MASSGSTAAKTPFDESRTPDAAVRPGWELLDLAVSEGKFGAELLRETTRLLADDGVTYTPTQPQLADGHSELAQAQPWQLDPVPLVMTADQWRPLELGLAQRAELLHRILIDLYTEQRLVTQGLLPPGVVFGHDDYLRPMAGEAAPSAHQLLLVGADIGRAHDGQWQVLSDRTQAPSGAGYAMENRRVTSRVLSELYHQSHLQRLTPFFHQLRMALIDAAPMATEDARVVVLSPGTHSETAFDQAFLAGLLGFPLVEGSDLTVSQGRVWLRSMGRPEPVDVIVRRVDSPWSDPLELKSNSRLGVTGLAGCVRAGTVAVVNSLGSGVVENPGLFPYLPRICRELLGEELRLASVPTWWLGDAAARAEVRSSWGELVVRPINATDGPGVALAELDRAEREQWWDRVRGASHRFVAQRRLPLSLAPSLVTDSQPSAGGSESGVAGVEPRPVAVRHFTVRRGATYVPMMGGLGQVGDVLAGREPLRIVVSKDLWVTEATDREARAEVVEAPPLGSSLLTADMLVPRMLDDLYWVGRYAERAEDLLRLALAVRHTAVENDFVISPDGALEHLLAAVTHVSASYPGFVDADPDPLAELRSLVLDPQRSGSVARSIRSLQFAAQGVRDQLSDDVWIVLGGIDRALASLRAARLDRGNQLADSAERILAGLLALTGITAENMVRDAGWHLLDVGRGIERSLQVTSLLRWTLTTVHPRERQDQVTEACLVAAESIVTFRRRHPRGFAIADVLSLLIRDPGNPRSVVFQLRRIQARLQSLPHASQTDRPLRMAAELADRLAEMSWPEIMRPADGRRTELTEWLDELHSGLAAIADAVSEHYLKPPPEPRSLHSGGEG